MTSFSCIVIGEGNVAQSCIHHLLDKGFDVTAVFTNTDHLVQFCQKENIRVFGRGVSIEKHVKAKNFDYLFSINNPRILSSSVLSLARCLSINYHDSPLPAYAGVNATSWAIIKGEKSHGVSWHIIEPGIDTGDILQFQAVDISEDDNALSLNMKCLDACLESFKRLVNDIMSSTICRQVQDITKRSYFGLHDVPPSLGVLNLEHKTQTTYNLARALEFGNHDNQLGSPKLCTSSGHFFLVTKAKLDKTKGNRNAPPGTILEVADDALVVATPTDCLFLSVSELDGRPVELGEYTGARLSCPEGLDLGIAKQIREQEPFWRRKVKDYEPATFFIQRINVHSRLRDHSVRCSLKTVSVLMPEVAVPVSGWSYDELITASFIAFLGRACCTSDVHVGLLAAKEEITPGYRPLYSDICPGVFSVNLSAAISDAIQAIIDALSRHKKGKTFLLDMFYRYPELRGNKQVPHHNIVIAFETEGVSVDPENYSKYLTDGNILILLSRQEMKIICEDKPGCRYNQVVDVVRHFSTFIKSLISCKITDTLLDIDMISKDELASLYGNQQNDSDEHSRDVLDSFVSYCRQQPDHMALTSTDIKLTYVQLSSEIDILSKLIKDALPPDYKNEKKCIALHFPNSVAFVVNVLTAVTLKCPFLPVPADLPTDRIDFMLHDARARLMMTSPAQFEKFRNLPTTPKVLFRTSTVYGDLMMVEFQIDQNTTDITEATCLHPQCAYVIYTSGSTGRPKGVQLTRSGLLNMAEAQVKVWYLGNDDVVAQFASISFDAVISEIFAAFACGGCLSVLHESEKLGDELIQALRRLEVTFITLPQSVLSVYQPRDFPTLKKLVTAGEACDLQTAVKWFRKDELMFFNGYGPAETTVSAAFYEYVPTDGSDGTSQDLPIGKAHDGVQIYLFDDFQKPVPPNIIGEIYIGGKGVAPGYIGHARSQNSTRFVRNPLRESEVLYRTGDYAVQDSEGILTFVGRLDNQVKIRGQRVNLGEIEQVLLKHSEVERAIVVKRASRGSGDACLAAFVAPATLKTAELREYLKKVLPKFMMPTYIKPMDAKDFPVTMNGKVDRKKLEEDESIFEQKSSIENSQLNQVELEVAKLWCKVIHLDETNASHMHKLSTFYELGGNSLHLVLLQRAIEEEMNVAVPFTDMVTASTIEDFVNIIMKKKDD